MAGLDDAGVYYADIGDDQGEVDQRKLKRTSVLLKFKEFIKKFHTVGTFDYPYRDQLKRHYNIGQYWIEVSLEDVDAFNESLAEGLKKTPTEYLALFEDAAKDVVDEITSPRPLGHETVEDIQVILRTEGDVSGIREIKADQMSKLVKLSGIVVAASAIRAKATQITLQCRGCRNYVNNITLKPGLDGYPMPRKCPSDQAGRAACPLDPYFIVPDKCKCVDFQVLKLQEAPESVPHGELPRHLQLYCDRWLCEKVAPGNRITVVGIYCIKKAAKEKTSLKEKGNVGTRAPYVRVLGIQIDTEGSGRSSVGSFTAEEEDLFLRLAARPDIYETVAKSIAPSIYGSLDIKKAVACLLLGGSRKKLPDGLIRRGDINVLLLGDPGTAKSQLLKFVERCSPIAVYTSGKGSSAAGLTASVIRDPISRHFVMEGGAMVLADGGVVCIDEFDKMREDDRVAIHEAMEQQTISIAKAGITTTLNSRCAVLAAANSIYGRWDDTKGEQNIDFMPTILSRFDMIFIVKDEHDEQRDTVLARHVINVHITGTSQQQAQPTAGEIDLATLKKFIAYCRQKVAPRMSPQAAEKLRNKYVKWRTDAFETEQRAHRRSAIPITVRQLEAIVRISESLAKMRLAPFALEQDVEEALRLFRVSTLDAAMSGQLAGAEGFTTAQDQQVLAQIEKQLKRRFVVGSQVSEQAILQEFARQKFNDHAVKKVILTMIRRGELQYRMQRKMLYRYR